MLSRLAQLCLLQAEARTGSRLLSCLHCHAPTSFTWPQQQHYNLHQQHYSSSSSTAELGTQQQQQQQQQQQHLRLPTDHPGQEGAAAASSSRVGAAQPTQPLLQVLKVLLEAERPLSSHELHARMQQHYAGFTTRNHFKAQLRQLQRQNWVAAKPAVAASARGHRKGHKGSGGHWLYSPTKLAWRVDLTAPGRPLQSMARRLADKWTREHLPGYIQHVREQRVPVTWENLGVLKRRSERQALFQRQVLAGTGGPAAAQQLPAGGEAATAGSLQQQ